MSDFDVYFSLATKCMHQTLHCHIGLASYLILKELDQCICSPIFMLLSYIKLRKSNKMTIQKKKGRSNKMLMVKLLNQLYYFFFIIIIF